MAAQVVSTFTPVYLGFWVNLIYEGFEPGHLHNMRRKTYWPWTSFTLFYICLSLLQKISLHKAYFFFRWWRLSFCPWMVLEKESCLIISSLENWLEVNNANCDLGMVCDLNMMKHLNQTTEAPLLVNKARENEECIEILREGWRTYGRNWGWHRQMWLWWVKGKIMREKKLMRKMNKCLILSASITGENVLHYKHMERSVLALSTRVLPVSKWNMT